VDLYEALRSQASPVQIVESQTSYFSAPALMLDPRLFRGSKLIPSVRNAVLGVLYGHLNQYYSSPESWTTVWLAGSGVSYQWTAHRSPGDLDCLVGVNFVAFREANTRYFGMSDKEIADMMNEAFREDVHPTTEEFMGAFELTFFVNTASDIVTIKPYAAYSLTRDDWTVEPTADETKFPEHWFSEANRDARMAQDIVSRYQQALNDLTMARDAITTSNAQTALLLAAKQGAALFEEIHGGRTQAFSPKGAGYSDFANFRWQSGKASGTVQAMKSLKDLVKKAQKESDVSLYGVELPDAATLIRRAASQYRTH